MRKGDLIIVVAGPHRGFGGRIRKRAKDGRYVMNLNGRLGLSACAYLWLGEIRRVENTQNGRACLGGPKGA
jgi:hypothetical protein